MDKEILEELRKIEAEIDKLSKLKLELEVKAQKIKDEIKTQNTKASPDVKSQPKNTEKKYKSKSKKQRKKEKKEKIKSKRDNKTQPKKTQKPSKTKIIPAKKFVKAPKSDKNQTKKNKTPNKTSAEKTIPFGTMPEKVITPSEPMSFIGMVVTGIIDRIEQALDGRSELVTIHTGSGNHVDTAEYNGSFISARSYYYRLDVASRSTVLLKICDEAKKEVKLINENDENALAAYKEGTLISNILVEKQDEILARLFKWVFSSDQKEEALSDIDALFPFTEAFGGTKYEKELSKALDEAANEDLGGGIEREEYDPDRKSVV